MFASRNDGVYWDGSKRVYVNSVTHDEDHISASLVHIDVLFKLFT